MIQIQKKSASRLVTAYNQMMQAMRNAYEHKGDSDISLQKALDQARYDAIKLQLVTVEEAHEIGEYIKHDINDAAEYMMDANDEFYDWLLQDIEIIERKIIDLFLNVADNTRSELDQLKDTGTNGRQQSIHNDTE